MSDERKLILEMLQSGKINVDEAEKLLEGLGEEKAENQPLKSMSKKFLKILVVEGDNTKVNINIPIALAEVGLKLIPKETLKIKGNEINLDEILRLIQEGCEGDFVNIDAVEKGREVKVKIFIA